MNTKAQKLLAQSSEILYRANEIHALFSTIKNSITYSIQNRENTDYILTSCELLEKMQQELINIADIHEQEFI